MTTLGSHSVKATTYISVEPIPSRDVVGQAALTRILSAGYPRLERWSNRLLTECGLVQSVIDALQSNGAIPTINAGNTSFRVAAGGFESITNPSFVATIDDSGADGVSEQDVNVLDNALGFVMLAALEELRQRHLEAVASLLDAIDKGKVGQHLEHQFKCPALDK